MEKAKGGRPEKNSPPRGESFYATAKRDNGISKKQAERWQQLAQVPEEDFEAALTAPEKPSTTGIIAEHKPKQEPMDPKALWLWGRLRDFEREGFLDERASDLMEKMTEGMKADVARLARLVSEWLEEVYDE